MSSPQDKDYTSIPIHDIELSSSDGPSQLPQSVPKHLPKVPEAIDPLQPGQPAIPAMKASQQTQQKGKSRKTKQPTRKSQIPPREGELPSQPSALSQQLHQYRLQTTPSGSQIPSEQPSILPPPGVENFSRSRYFPAYGAFDREQSRQSNLRKLLRSKKKSSTLTDGSQHDPGILPPGFLFSDSFDRAESFTIPRSTSGVGQNDGGSSQKKKKSKSLSKSKSQTKEPRTATLADGDGKQQPVDGNEVVSASYAPPVTPGVPALSVASQTPSAALITVKLPTAKTQKHGKEKRNPDEAIKVPKRGGVRSNLLYDIAGNVMVNEYVDMDAISRTSSDERERAITVDNDADPDLPYEWTSSVYEEGTLKEIRPPPDRPQGFGYVRPSYKPTKERREKAILTWQQAWRRMDHRFELIQIVLSIAIVALFIYLVDIAAHTESHYQREGGGIWNKIILGHETIDFDFDSEGGDIGVDGTWDVFDVELLSKVVKRTVGVYFATDTTVELFEKDKPYVDCIVEMDGPIDWDKYSILDVYNDQDNVINQPTQHDNTQQHQYNTMVSDYEQAYAADSNQDLNHYTPNPNQHNTNIFQKSRQTLQLRHKARKRSRPKGSRRSRNEPNAKTYPLKYSKQVHQIYPLTMRNIVSSPHFQAVVQRIIQSIQYSFVATHRQPSTHLLENIIGAKVMTDWHAFFTTLAQIYQEQQQQQEESHLHQSQTRTESDIWLACIPQLSSTQIIELYHQVQVMNTFSNDELNELIAHDLLTSLSNTQSQQAVVHTTLDVNDAIPLQYQYTPAFSFIPASFSSLSPLLPSKPSFITQMLTHLVWSPSSAYQYFTKPLLARGMLAGNDDDPHVKHYQLTPKDLGPFATMDDEPLEFTQWIQNNNVHTITIQFQLVHYTFFAGRACMRWTVQLVLEIERGQGVSGQIFSDDEFCQEEIMTGGYTVIQRSWAIIGILFCIAALLASFSYKYASGIWIRLKVWWLYFVYRREKKRLMNHVSNYRDYIRNQYASSTSQSQTEPAKKKKKHRHHSRHTHEDDDLVLPLAINSDTSRPNIALSYSTYLPSVADSSSEEDDHDDINDLSHLPPGIAQQETTTTTTTTSNLQQMGTRSYSISPHQTTSGSAFGITSSMMHPSTDLLEHGDAPEQRVLSTSASSATGASRLAISTADGFNWDRSTSYYDPVGPAANANTNANATTTQWNQEYHGLHPHDHDDIDIIPLDAATDHENTALKKAKKRKPKDDHQKIEDSVIEKHDELLQSQDQYPDTDTAVMHVLYVDISTPLGGLINTSYLMLTATYKHYRNLSKRSQLPVYSFSFVHFFFLLFYCLVTFIYVMAIIVGKSVFIVLSSFELRFVLACIAFCSPLLFYPTFSSFPRAYTVWQTTVWTALPYLIPLLIGNIPVLIGFVLFGWLQFSAIAPRFESFSHTMMHLFAVMKGDEVQDVFNEVAYGLGARMHIVSRIFLYVFTLYFLLILYKMIFGVVAFFMVGDDVDDGDIIDTSDPNRYDWDNDDDVGYLFEKKQLELELKQLEQEQQHYQNTMDIINGIPLSEEQRNFQIYQDIQKQQQEGDPSDATNKPMTRPGSATSNVDGDDDEPIELYSNVIFVFTDGMNQVVSNPLQYIADIANNIPYDDTKYINGGNALSPHHKGNLDMPSTPQNTAANRTPRFAGQSHLSQRITMPSSVSSRNQPPAIPLNRMLSYQGSSFVPVSSFSMAGSQQSTSKPF